MIITSVYMGNLTAALSVRRVRVPFSTIQELADHPTYGLRLARHASVRQTLEVSWELTLSYTEW